MASMKNDTSNSQASQNKRSEKSYNREDEINLADFFRIILKWKYFILVCSVLPALLVGIILFISPKDFKVTFTYDISPDKSELRMPPGEFINVENANKSIDKSGKDELSEKKRRILLESFFDPENIDKLAAKLRKNGFDEYAQEISGAKIRLSISGTLLTMTIYGSSRDDLKKITPIVRENFELNMLIYSAKQELSSNISLLKTEIAEIEENKFNMELELENQKVLLTKLKDMTSAEPNNIHDGIVLHFDNASANKAYLPWEYQARAAQANQIYIEEAIRTNQKKVSHYRALIEQNNKLLNDIGNNSTSYDNVQEFRSFLNNITGDYQNTELNDYLYSYNNKIENAISTYTPLIENPKIYSVPKNILKKSSIVFLALLIISMFLSFLLEAVRKNRSQAS